MFSDERLYEPITFPNASFLKALNACFQVGLDCFERFIQGIPNFIL